MPTNFWKGPHWGRREFFRLGAAALSGYWLRPRTPGEALARAAASPRGTAKNCIFVLLTGAPSHVDTWDLKVGHWTPPALGAERAGGTMWPAGYFPLLGRMMSDFTLVRSVRSWAVEHGLGMAWLEIARSPASAQGPVAPHIGSVIASELGPRSQQKLLPPFFHFNAPNRTGNSFLGPETSPLSVFPNGQGFASVFAALEEGDYTRRRELLRELNGDEPEARGGRMLDFEAFGAAGRDLLYNPAVENIFRTSSDEVGRYGPGAFGAACIAARNLVSADLGTRFVEISFGNWDHHINIYGALPGMCRELDRGLSALIADLKESGRLEETLVVVMGEFGRTVGPLNAASGRDHYPIQTALMAGGGIRGGQVVGATDAVGAEIVDNGWSLDRAVRAEDIACTMYSALGIDWTRVIRDERVTRFDYVVGADTGEYRPVDELF